MKIKLLLYLIIIIALVVPSGLAAEATVKNISKVGVTAPVTSTITKIALPDLVVNSATVMGPPVVISTAKTVLIPMEITVKNIGTKAAGEFNVGGEARATDGNAYGYWFIVPGKAEMEGRAGVLVPNLNAGGTATFKGFMVLVANPVTATLEPGTRYAITAMVDYNLDPDSSSYEWGVKELKEDNNSKAITYP